MGIEPTSPGWEPGALPLSYARTAPHYRAAFVAVKWEQLWYKLRYCTGRNYKVENRCGTLIRWLA